MSLFDVGHLCILFEFIERSNAFLTPLHTWFAARVRHGSQGTPSLELQREALELFFNVV